MPSSYLSADLMMINARAETNSFFVIKNFLLAKIKTKAQRLRPAGSENTGALAVTKWSGYNDAAGGIPTKGQNTKALAIAKRRQEL